MNPELKAKWVAELKSGTKPQGRERLKSELGSYCCLGVLAEVAGVELPQGALQCDDDGEEREVYAKFGETISTEEALGNIAPMLGMSPDVEQTLITLNDGDSDKVITPRSFEEIAKWIETHNLLTGKPISEGEPSI